MEGKLEEVQFEFRTGRRTADAIFVLNVVNKKTKRKKGKIFAFFTDLKAAFDKVDRTKLKEMMERADVSDRLRRKIMETYKEMKNKVKTGERSSEEFWTRKGLRQGCPLNPTLFNLYIMDLEAEIQKEQTGGVMAGKEKF